MIVRKYGRRSRDLKRSYSGANSFPVVDLNSSQELSQDVCNFSLSSQDCQCSDPYDFNSSQEIRELKILPTRKVAFQDCDEGFRQPKKVKVIDVDSETNGSGSSQEWRELEILGSRYDEGGTEGFGFSVSDFRKSKKVKKINFDPYAFGSSQELKEYSVMPTKMCGDDRDLEHEIWKPNRFKKVVSDSCGSSQELNELAISFPKKFKVNRDSWAFDRDYPDLKNKGKGENKSLQNKKNKNQKKMKLKTLGSDNACLTTTTLMETQEFGEMMEHMDEVDFALDGLKGQQLKIQRASFLSLISICGSAQQRRLLRAHGMVKPVIDAVLGLNLDDSSSNLAAAALFYILMSDGQYDLLDSPKCIRFLLKLLKPVTVSAASKNVPTIGSKLIGMCKNNSFLQGSAKGTDSSSSAILLKVEEILINSKEIKARDGSDDRIERPELNPKWISLLTMEKACISALSIEDTYGTFRKTDGSFKEKLRVCGGLDVVFEEARRCHSIMQEWLNWSPHFDQNSKEILGLENLVLLMKCLKILENATFLSNDNQRHLLRIKGNFDGRRGSNSFTNLILSLIKILSGVCLLRNSSGSSHEQKKSLLFSDTSQSTGCCSMDETISQEKLIASRCQVRQTKSFMPCLESNQGSSDSLLLEMRIESSTAGSCSGSVGNSDAVLNASSVNSEVKLLNGRRQLICTKNAPLGGSQDPYAFHEDEFEPSKWDVLSGSSNTFNLQKSRVEEYESIGVNRSHLILSQQESSNTGNCHDEETTCSSPVDEEQSILLGDCLLTAVKVLMNLTNDNPEGCQQIAASGGLEILSSLIAGHFSSFTLSSAQFDDLRDNSSSSKSSPFTDRQNNTDLSDQELDFLVAILGLLVNLVEKDGRNRSRIAVASVSLPSLEGVNDEDHRDMISLLCSIFLANQGAGETAGEGKCFSWEDEDSIIQGEKEAEKMIVEAYSALLLAFLSTESKTIRNAIAECLPKKNISILVPVLERFVEFHMTLNMIPPETHKAVLEVIESCRIP